MKKYGFSRTGLIAIAGVLVVGAIVLGGIHAKRTLVHLQATTEREWVSFAGQCQRRDVLASKLLETASKDPKFDKAALVSAETAQEALNKIRVNPVRPSDSVKLDQYQDAQKSFNMAMGKVLRATLMKSTDPKTKRELQPLVLDLVKADNEIAVHTNRFNVYAQIYNTALHRFPTGPYATLLGFAPQPSFTLGREPGAVASNATGAR